MPTALLKYHYFVVFILATLYIYYYQQQLDSSHHSFQSVCVCVCQCLSLELILASKCKCRTTISPLPFVLKRSPEGFRRKPTKSLVSNQPVRCSVKNFLIPFGLFRKPGKIVLSILFRVRGGSCRKYAEYAQYEKSNIATVSFHLTLPADLE